MSLRFSDTSAIQGLICHYPELLPYRDPYTDWGGGQSLNSSIVRIAYVFRTFRACRLQALRIFLYSVTGSPSASDIVFELRNILANGNPDQSGSPIASVTLPDLTTGIKTIEFPTHSLAANKVYCVVVKNVNSNPASNYVTIQHRRHTYTVHPFWLAFRSGYTDDGSSWIWSVVSSVTNYGSPNFEYALTDGDTTQYYGAVNTNNYTDYNLNAANRILAIQTTMPFRCQLLGLTLRLHYMSGTLSDTIRLRVWRVVSGSLEPVHTSSSLQYVFTPMTIAPDDAIELQKDETYRVGVEKVSGTSTFIFRTLLQEGWRQYPTVHYYNGSAWTDLTNGMVAMALVLRPLEPAGGGGGSPVFIPTHRIIT